MTPPPTQTEAQAYLDGMVACRGYVLDHHKAMAANDFPVLRAVNSSFPLRTSPSAR